MSEPLELSPEAMRRLGYRVVDQIVEARTAKRDMPVANVLSRPAGESLLREPVPQAGSDPEALVDFLGKEVFSQVTHVDHPRFFAFVPGVGNYIGAMADALAAGHNVFSGTWLGGSAAAQMELVVLDWLREACGLPESAGGILVSGGSVANLTALAAARRAILGSHGARGLVYYSDQTHSAVTRGLRILGFDDDCLRPMPTDPAGHLSADAVRLAVEEDTRAGHRPFCIVANAGTTNTGAVDPLRELSGIAREHGLWFHVDGAYGTGAMFGDRGRDALDGLALADSIALDPHKWLFQPFECGCLLMRDGMLLRDAFAVHPEYMADTIRDLPEVNFCDYGVQLSRSFRALKLWLTFKTFGARAIGAAIDRSFDLADVAHRWLSARTAWEIVTPPEMAILTFAPRGADSETVSRMSADLRDGGFAMVSTTTIGGRTVIRLCPINPRSTEADVIETLEALDRLR